MSKISWIEIKSIRDRQPLKYLHDLDKGEAEVIILANEINADLVIIDEKAGREFAEHFNLKLTGTIGVLLKAKETGLIQEIKSLLNKMIENCIWIYKKLTDKIIELSNEK